MKTKIFEPIKIGNIEIKNRLVMEPMGLMGLADREGGFNQRAIDFYVERAKGGVGLIITGFTKVENEIEQMKMPSFTCVTHNPTAFINSAYELTERVHAYGTKIFLQVSAGLGRSANPKLLVTKPIAPSAIPNFWDPSITCRELTTDEVEKIISRFEEAGRIAKETGFDGIELHAVHEGYLADQFAMSVFNRRTDKFGGSLKDRATFPIEILKAIRRGAGQDYPVTVRYGLRSFIKDWNQGGIDVDQPEIGRNFEEGLKLAKILEEAGYDALNADVGSYDGWYWAHPPLYQEEGLYLPFTKELKKVVNIPVIVAGKLGNPELAETALNENKADMIGLARPLLTDSEWPNKVKKGNEENIRPCIGCHDGCLQRIFSHRPISCGINPATGREKIYGIEKALETKKVIIIGAGIAGLEAARVSTLRGHEVALYEKTNVIGGHIHEASAPDFKMEDRRLLSWYENELKRLNIDVKMNTVVTPDIIKESKADVVIVATGSNPVKLNFLPGMDKDNICCAEDLLLGKKIAGNTVVIVGGGLVGCETALWLAQQGKDVTVVEGLGDVIAAGPTINHANKSMLKDLMEKYNVKIMTNTKLSGVNDEGVYLSQENKNITVPAETICIAVGYKSETTLFHEIKNSDAVVHIIGDAAKVANIMKAVWDAYEVARNI
ncbi:oxidoreductase [Clostridium estertheticum]|uniref:oxidoreductase n=1 Tax=Clostridium estertheticum TaxID=238834 RepID=UPI001C7D7209|nr:FAD-dependent oxidoreductase [Clostridium estertheticum]MBX4270054.1 FAD-dependent oxidoreductase [Clostridium estertheticum]WLC80258.1 FAD-dependent oxidoreductase [Clostridium estertheticum]